MILEPNLRTYLARPIPVQHPEMLGIRMFPEGEAVRSFEPTTREDFYTITLVYVERAYQTVVHVSALYQVRSFGAGAWSTPPAKRTANFYKGRPSAHMQRGTE